MDYTSSRRISMPNTKTHVPFNGTREQEAALRDIIAKHKDHDGAVLPILQEAQAIYGYLPEEVQIIIAEGLGISLSEVYGIVSFYTQFTVNPKGKHQASVCMGTACYVKGSGDILEQVEKKLCCKAGEITKDGKFSVDSTRCIGACGLAAVMTVDEDVYGRITANDVDSILDKYTN
jgi:NADH-quinone oxidoreductase subunit E/NADP-reducing hydrogenase subunit HndA